MVGGGLVWFCGKRDAIVRLREEALLVKHGKNKK